MENKEMPAVWIHEKELRSVYKSDNPDMSFEDYAKTWYNAVLDMKRTPYIILDKEIEDGK